MRFFNLFWSNRTKCLGFAQITLGAIAAYDGIFEPRTVKIMLMVSGVLTAWVGFFNSAKARDE